MSDRVYSSVPASWVGRSQRIEIGPMSGASNVTHWLSAHHLRAEPDLVQRILDCAKASNHSLTDAQIQELVAGQG